MKLTGFHLDASLVRLEPIGPGLTVVQCPPLDQVAPVSDSLRAVLFGALREDADAAGLVGDLRRRGDGRRLGSVDVADHWGSGRLSRQLAGDVLGPLEVSSHERHDRRLAERIDELTRTTRRLHVVDFSDAAELSRTASDACRTLEPHVAMEAPDVEWHSGHVWREDDDRRDSDWVFEDHGVHPRGLGREWDDESARRGRAERRRERLLARRRELLAERSRWRHAWDQSWLGASRHGLAELLARHDVVRSELEHLDRELRHVEFDSLGRPLSHDAGDYPIGDESRRRAFDSQVDRIEQVCRRVHAREVELQRRLADYERGRAPRDFADVPRDADWERDPELRRAMPLEGDLEHLREVAASLDAQAARLDRERDTAPVGDSARWDEEVAALRRTADELRRSVGRQSHSHQLDWLRNELKQLRRYRHSLRQRLHRLWGRRDTWTTEWAPRLAPVEWERLRARRDSLVAELRRLDRDIAAARRSPHWRDSLYASFDPSLDVQLDDELAHRDPLYREQIERGGRYDHRPHEIDAELARIDAELSRIDTWLRYRTPRPESRTPTTWLRPLHTSPDSPLLPTAATLLSRLTEGELTRIRYDHPANTLFVTDYEGKPHASYDLPSDTQRMVALSLVLAASDPRFPVVLDRLFEEIPQSSIGAAVEVLRECARHGRQIVVVVYDPTVAERLRAAHIEVRRADSTAPAAVPERRIYRGPAVVGRTGRARSDRAGAERASIQSAGGPAMDDDSTWDAWTPESARRREATEPARWRRVERPARIFDDQASRVVSRRDNRSGRHHLDFSDPVTRVPFFARETGERLEQFGYWTVADLLRGDAPEIAAQLHGRAHADEVRRWQAQCQLMCSIPRLRPFDARVLVACGVTDPVQLQDTEPRSLLRRVETFLETPEGLQLVRSGSPFEIARIKRWIESAGSAPRRAASERQRSRRAEGQETVRRAVAEGVWSELGDDVEGLERRELERRAFGERTPRERTERTRRERASSERASRERAPGERRARRKIRGARRQGSPSERTNRVRTDSTPRPIVSGAAAASGQVLRFHLDTASDVEAAPSIGPKTAELFYQIGVRTVGDLLARDPAEQAEKLGHDRITASMIKEWQHQATLVCRIPELRGHDAQLLVACGVLEAERVAEYQPSELFSLVDALAKSKAGQRIIRNGKAPTLEEITDWIRWSKQARQLRAA